MWVHADEIILQGCQHWRISRATRNFTLCLAQDTGGAPTAKTNASSSMAFLALEARRHRLRDWMAHPGTQPVSSSVNV